VNAEMILSPEPANLTGRGKDRLITGATAKVPRQSFLYHLPCGIMVVFVQPEKSHDEARGTITALCTVVLQEELLYRVQDFTSFFINGKVLNSDQLFAVKHGEEHKTGIDYPVYQFTVVPGFGDHYRAGAAIPFCTTFFNPFMIL